MPIHLTKNAAEQIKTIAEDAEFEDGWNLELGVKSGGCSGLQYEFNIWESASRENDRVFEQHGVTVRVHPRAYLYLNGVTVDYKKDGLDSGFVFSNPNAKRSCGCGTSFTT